ncbi:MAG: ATP-binding protein [Methanosphaera stadtmanae]|nr:ATP-binding protein [Methanosphaera stadtmanae]
MVRREQYLDKLYKLKDTDDVKIITGVRRSGKTHLIKTYANELKENGIVPENIIYISFESNKYKYIKTDTQLDELINTLTKNVDGKLYLFFDEIHKVSNWEESINGYRVDLDSDIYITGSYGQMLNGINSTVLSGRYVRIKIYPFSFKEVLKYYEDNGYEINQFAENNIFNEYLTFGGLPGHFKYEGASEKLDYLSDVYDSIMLKDIFDIEKVSSTALYRNLMEFMIDNIGHEFSVNSITKYLKHEKSSSKHDTIRNYLMYATNAYLLYKVKRKDIKGKEILKTLEKYYIIDQGFYYLFKDENNRNIGQLLENVVYIELLRRGYKVTIGKINKLEVDFVCEKPGKTLYVQVSNSILDDQTRNREYKSLEKINDNYTKYILTMDTINLSRNGIIHKNIIEFLKEN